MSTQETCPDSQSLREILNRGLPSEKESELTRHIEVCAECRHRLERLAGDETLWAEVREHLSGNDTSDVSFATDDPESDLHPSTSAAVQQLVALLGPTDDPKMLGRLGGYEVLGVLGCGGTGVVVKALDVRLNRYVAIKVLHPHLSSTASARTRFAREGRAIAAVSHDHVVPVYSVDEHRGVPYIVMELVSGASLRRRIEDEGPLDTTEIVRVSLQVARALEAAHAQGVIHRDIKPENILLDQGVERVRVTDFGLARVADEAHVTRSDVIAGTPQYMAPEQVRGEALDARTDLFSLGSTIYAMAVGHPPFQAASVYGVLRSVTDETPPPLARVNGAQPEWLAQFVQKLMEKDPANRFQTASEVAEFLGEELAYRQSPSASRRPARSWLRAESTPRRRAALKIARAGGVFLAAALLVFLVVSAILAPPSDDGDPREDARPLAGESGDANDAPSGPGGVDSSRPGPRDPAIETAPRSRVPARSLRVSGTVMDAETGQPLDDFEVVPLLRYPGGRPRPVRRSRLRAEVNVERSDRGAFVVELSAAHVSVRELSIRVEALGYRTAGSTRRFRIGDEDATLDFALERVERFRGRVIDVDGRPLRRGRVYVVSAYQTLDLDGLRDRGGTIVTSNDFVDPDPQGAFEIVPQSEPYSIVVIADSGYAQVSRRASELPGEIELSRWGRVEGRLIQSGESVPDWSVYFDEIVDRTGDVRISSRIHARTRDDGTFVFDRVPPIAGRVHAALHFANSAPLTSSRSIPLVAKAGETTHLVLGGGGAEVRGRLAVANAPDGFDYHYSLSYLVAKRPGVTAPPSLAAKGFDWRGGWTGAWLSTTEGQSFLETLEHFFVKPEPDGRIRISGVPPGEYDLAIHLYGEATNGCLVEPVASRVLEVSVGEEATKIDLGRVDIPLIEIPRVGDLAPSFSAKDVEGREVRLNDYRGRYVLLDFWATWCAPCVAGIDKVEALRSSYPDLTVVGVNLDAERERAEAFLERRSLPWIHVLLGRWSGHELPSAFAISSIPTYALVGPDGRIAAYSKTLDAIAAAMSRTKSDRESDGAKTR